MWLVLLAVGLGLVADLRCKLFSCLLLVFLFVV